MLISSLLNFPFFQLSLTHPHTHSIGEGVVEWGGVKIIEKGEGRITPFKNDQKREKKFLKYFIFYCEFWWEEILIFEKMSFDAKKWKW